MVVCDKISYDEYKDAKSHISGLVKRKGGSYRVYKCNDCGKFHVTTLPKRNKKLKPLREKNYKPEETHYPTVQNIHCKIKKNKSKVQKSITTTYRPFEHFNKP